MNLRVNVKATNYVRFQLASKDRLKIIQIAIRTSNLNSGTYKLAIIIEKAHSFRYLMKPPSKVFIPAPLFISHSGMQINKNKQTDNRSASNILINCQKLQKKFFVKEHYDKRKSTRSSWLPLCATKIQFLKLFRKWHNRLCYNINCVLHGRSIRNFCFSTV